ncbi:MAG: response regulator [Verrucomicrobiota bacterium]|nr:response regulator [Verrucomicrobiota bacterium]
MKEKHNYLSEIKELRKTIAELELDKKKLMEDQEELSVIYHNAPIIMILVDKDVNVIKINSHGEKFAKNKGYESFGEAIGKVLGCLHNFDDSKGCGYGPFCNKCPIRNTVIDTFKTEKPHKNVETTLPFMRNTEEKNMTFLLFTSIIKFKQKPLVLVSFLDITEEKEANEEQEKLREKLFQAQKMESIGRLAGGVAHDFNNKLAVILGYAEMVKEQVDYNSPLHDKLEEICNAATHSRDIVKQLLSYARKEKISPKIIDLNLEISQMHNMLQFLIGENIKLIWSPGTDIWALNIDPTQINQIIANLCVNAKDAINEQGNIFIKTKNVCVDEAYSATCPSAIPGDFILLEISDDGCGMDKDIFDKIFEPFFTTKGLAEGTGLGLSTVLGIVKQNNGFIYVYSEKEHGTTFKIYFPRYCGEGSKTIISENPLQKSLFAKGETILLVEDDPEIKKMTQIILKEFGYKVFAVDSAKKALEVADFHNGPLDMLISDVVMPNMNGCKLANKIKSIYPNIKILFMSGYTADILTDEDILKEKINFLQKPFSRNNLLIKIREILDEDTMEEEK